MSGISIIQHANRHFSEFRFWRCLHLVANWVLADVDSFCRNRYTAVTVGESPQSSTPLITCRDIACPAHMHGEIFRVLRVPLFVAASALEYRCRKNLKVASASWDQVFPKHRSFVNACQHFNTHFHLGCNPQDIWGSNGGPRSCSGAVQCHGPALRILCVATA